MELVHEMTYHAMLRPPMQIGDGPFGTRMFFDVTGGEVEGPRVRGSGRVRSERLGLRQRRRLSFCTDLREHVMAR